MGRIAKIIDAIRGTRNGAKITDIKADPGGQDIAQAEQFNTAGDDSHPLPNDYAIFVQLPSGAYACVGNIDPKNAQTAERGERRIYSRNAAGEQVAEIWLKADGTIILDNDEASITIKPDGEVETTNGSAASTIKPDGEVETTNGAGFYTLLANGTVDINGFTIAPKGVATSPVAIIAPTMTAGISLTVNGIEVLGHDHEYAWTDPAGSDTTGGMNP